MSDQFVKCFRNADEIAEYIGEDKRCISQLVSDEGLPAWKRRGCGPWRALNIDLDKWLIGQRTKYLHSSKHDAVIDQ